MNINKPCASCTKVVYPLEQIKFLDVVWHKSCFKCEVCKTILNTRTCKGYERKIYCAVHYPKPSYTFVADTPEIQRVATNTKFVSNIKYHEDFEKSKGSKISVSDDPVLNRQKQNTENSSQLAYTGAQEKKISMEAHRPSGTHENVTQQNLVDSNVVVENSRTSSRPGSIYDYEPGSRSSQIVGHKSGNSTTFYARSKNEPSSDQDSRHSTHSEKSNGDAKSGSDNTKDKQVFLRAIYNYTAQEDDEASFLEGDVILDHEIIDDGWMYGTVQRTGEYGMLPTNYFETVE